MNDDTDERGKGRPRVICAYRRQIGRDLGDAKMEVKIMKLNNFIVGSVLS